MNQILDENIRQIITQWPAVEAALGEFNIGCVTCSLGSCRLRDIIEIHNLSPQQEHSLFSKIAAIAFPGKTIEIPALPRKPVRTGTERSLSPPIRTLIDEHVSIKRVIAAVPRVCATFEPDKESSRQLVQETINFIRGYADRFHHAKEEDILFGLFAENNEIIATMRAEHEVGRAHIGAAQQGLTSGDRTAVAEHLNAWAQLLIEHIRKEDEILFPWMDRQLTDSQIGRLFTEFNKVEDSFAHTPNAFVAFSQAIGN